MERIGAPKQIEWSLDSAFKRRIPYAFDTLVVDEYTGTVGKTVLQWGDDERNRRDIAPGDLIQLTQLGARWDEVYVINLEAQSGKNLKFTIGGPELVIRPQVTQQRLVDSSGTVINPATKENQDTIISKLTMTLTELKNAILGAAGKTLSDIWQKLTDQLNITLSALRDAIRGTGDKTLTDLDSRLSTVGDRLGNGTSVVDGTVSVGTSAVQLPNVSVRQGTSALLRLASSATDSVRIGGDSTPTFLLEPGEKLTVPVDNLNRLYARAVSGTQTLYYMVVQ